MDTRTREEIITSILQKTEELKTYMNVVGDIQGQQKLQEVISYHNDRATMARNSEKVPATESLKFYDFHLTLLAQFLNIVRSNALYDEQQKAYQEYQKTVHSITNYNSQKENLNTQIPVISFSPPIAPNMNQSPAFQYEPPLYQPKPAFQFQPPPFVSNLMQMPGVNDWVSQTFTAFEETHKQEILKNITRDIALDDISLLTLAQREDLKALTEELAKKRQEGGKLREKNTKGTRQYKKGEQLDKDITECINETRNVINSYIINIKGLDKEIGSFLKNPITDEKDINQKIAVANRIQNQFTKAATAYEKKAIKWTTGQKVFIGACTFVGGLLGATLGVVAIVGLTLGGAAIGHIPGALLGGIAGIKAFVASMGLGSSMGAAAAIAILGVTGTGAISLPAIASSTSKFKTGQQKAQYGLKGKMEAEVRADTQFFKDKTQIAKERAVLKKEQFELKPTDRFFQSKFNSKQKKLQDLTKKEEKLDEAYQTRKNPSKKS